MGEVRTIMDESVISFDVANEKVKALALTLGAPAPEVAAGLYQTLSAGVTDAAEAFILLEQAGQLAVAGVASTSEAVDLLTTVTNAYGEVVTAQGIEKTSDMIQKTIQLGKTTMPELAASMGQVLPTASALGVSFEEVAASVATLTLSGLSTSRPCRTWPLPWTGM
jgi:TP901 family phage tail tape measure protein